MGVAGAVGREINQVTSHRTYSKSAMYISKAEMIINSHRVCLKSGTSAIFVGLAAWPGNEIQEPHPTLYMSMHVFRAHEHSPHLSVIDFTCQQGLLDNKEQKFTCIIFLGLVPSEPGRE